MSSPARILVVDDDASIRKVVSIILGSAGYLVDTAQNGVEAIEKSNVEFYNLALIDVRLPDVEGTKLLSLIQDATPRMIKIIMTGYPALENAVEAISRGVDGFLTKPVNKETLLMAVHEHLMKQQKENEFTAERVEAYVSTRLKEARANRREFLGETSAPHA